MAILDDNEFVEVEGRQYLNPQVALDESNQFIDNLRSTQQANNQEIQTQTYNLGSELPSQLGGLGAPGDTSLSYFTSRYQTPQTVSAVANLRATAQAAALNQVLANEQAKWQKRYNDAYRKYQKSAYDKSNSPSGSGGGDGEAGQGAVEEVDTSLFGGGRLYLDEQDIANGGQYVVSMDGDGSIIRVNPELDVNDPNYNQIYVQQPDGTYKLRSAIVNNQNNRMGTGGVLQNTAPLSSALRSNL